MGDIGKEVVPKVTVINQQRRNLLKSVVLISAGAAVGGALVSVLKSLEEQKSPERLNPTEIRVAALRTTPDDPGGTLRALKQLFSEQGPLDLIVTAEDTFLYSEIGADGYGSKEAQLVINHSGKGYEVDEQSDECVKSAIDLARLLAYQNKSHIFLSSFNERVSSPDNNEKSHTTMLHIDGHGNIIGIKRKFEPPEGDFTMDINGKVVKVLPLICGEAWDKTIVDQISGKRTNLPPEWVNKGAPFDVLIHSLRQGDLSFEDLQQDVVDGNPVPSGKKPSKEWLIDTFNTYYSAYFPHLVRGAPIVVADNLMAGIFEPNLQPIETIKDRGSYVSATVKVG